MLTTREIAEKLDLHPRTVLYRASRLGVGARLGPQRFYDQAALDLIREFLVGRENRGKLKPGNALWRQRTRHGRPKKAGLSPNPKCPV